jgi:hypothetical protein
MTTRAPSLGRVLRDPLLFSRLLWIVTTEDVDGRPVPVERRLIPNWTQRTYLANRTPRDLILKPRQEGISTIIQAEFARYLYTRRFNALTLMDIDGNTATMRRKQDFFYKQFPAVIMTELGEFRKPARDASNETFTVYDTGGVHTMATAGRTSVSRGDSLNAAHLSEAALYKNLYEVRLSVTQAGRPMWIVLESTAHGAQGDFYELCMKAHDGDPTWTLHFFAWFHVPTNRLPLADGEVLSYSEHELMGRELYGWDDEQIKWRRRKKAETGYKFEQEYPESVESAFLKSVAGMFGTMERNWGAPQGATPQPGIAYRVGIDTGQEEDYTVVSVMRADTPVQVDVLRLRRMPYRVMREQYIIPLFQKWRPEFGYVEVDGIGKSMYEELTADLRQHGLTECKLEPFRSASEKPMLIQSYNDDISDIVNPLQLLPLPEQKAEHLIFEARPAGKGRWTYGAPNVEGAHDDFVIADALAAHARRRVVPRASITVTRWGQTR